MAGSVTINANTSMDSDLPDILLPTVTVTVAGSSRTGERNDVPLAVIEQFPGHNTYITSGDIPTKRYPALKLQYKSAPISFL